jgi:hypothetical protein
METLRGFSLSRFVHTRSFLIPGTSPTTKDRAHREPTIPARSRQHGLADGTASCEKVWNHYILRRAKVMCDNCNRRDFLGASAMGGLLLAASQVRGEAAGAADPALALPSKVKIGVLFAGRPTPCDRAWGVCEQEIAAMTERLKQAEKNLGNVEFVIGKQVPAGGSHGADAASRRKRSRAGDQHFASAVCCGCISRFWKAAGRWRSSPPRRAATTGCTPSSGVKEGKPVTMFTSSDLQRAGTRRPTACASFPHASRQPMCWSSSRLRGTSRRACSRGG